MKKITMLIVCAIFLASLPAAAKERVFYKELNIVAGYTDSNKWVARESMGQNSSLGFEYFEKFAGEYGDYMTIDVQPRLAYDPNIEFHNAWFIELHNAWAEFKLGLAQKHTYRTF